MVFYSIVNRVNAETGNLIGDLSKIVGGNLVNNLTNTATKALGALAPTNPISLDKGVQAVANKIGLDTTMLNPANIAQNTIRNALGAAVGAGANNVFSVPTAAGFDGLGQRLGVQFTPSPNPLNDYANYAYHIRFFMANEVQAYNNVNPAAPNADSLTKVIIAESGVTAAFNIVDLKFNNTTSANKSQRNMWSLVKMSMTINEPLNLSLLDKMYAASRTLVIANHMRCPYFVEIWFKGYDENGNIMANNAFYNLYRVNIRDISVQTTSAGSQYTLQLYGDGAYSEVNSVSTPPSSIQVRATTLGEFLTKFFKAWNAAAATVNNDNVQRLFYKIDYPKDWDNWPIKNVEVAKQNARNTDMKAQIDGAETVVSISRGQSIENIVNFVVYLCDNAQKWITGENSTGGANLQANGLIRYVSVHAESKILDSNLDPVTQDYVREITYHLVPTESVRSYTDMETVKQIQTSGVQASKLAYLAQTNRLRKRYHYIYTGKNTEVTNFNIKIDRYWAIAQPLYNQVNNYNQITTGGVVDQGSIGYQQTRGTATTMQNGTQSKLDKIDQAIAAGVTSIGDTPIEQARSAAVLAAPGAGRVGFNTATALANENAPSTSSTAASSANQRLTNNLTSGDEALAAAAQITVPAPTPQARPAGRGASLANKYIEDAARVTAGQAPLPVVGMFDPAPRQQNVGPAADQNKIPAQRDPQMIPPGTGFIGAIFGNVFDNSAFQRIELEIVGDPWWLPISNIKQNFIASQLVGNNPTVGSSLQQAEFLGGDNSIMFEYRIGVVIDEATGLALTSANSADMVTGIYTVREVENVFNRGKFTQRLKCSKDVLAQNPVPTQQDSPPGTPTQGGQNQSVNTTSFPNFIPR